MSKVMTAEQFYDSITENYTTVELMDEYAKYLLEAHKEHIKENIKINMDNSIAYQINCEYDSKINEAHKQFLDNL